MTVKYATNELMNMNDRTNDNADKTHLKLMREKKIETLQCMDQTRPYSGTSTSRMRTQATYYKITHRLYPNQLSKRTDHACRLQTRPAPLPCQS